MRTGPLLALLLAAGCVGAGGQPAPTGVPAAYRVVDFAADDVDSLAVWPPGPWVIATAKATHRLLVFEAGSGRLLRDVGGPGAGPGQLARPNGIAVIGDLVLVVERDNRRVQAFALPEFRPLGTFGDAVLRRPYGLAAAVSPEGAVEAWVTDNYEAAGGAVPPEAELGERVKRFRVRVEPGGVQGELISSFGATAGDGVLRVVESIAVDRAAGVLLIADEDAAALDYKVYTLDGRFTGTVAARGALTAQPEGIVLLECGTGGAWIATEQHERRTVFHLLDRRTFAPLAAFASPGLANTDGIALSRNDFPGLPGGALFAVDDDRGVAALALRELARIAGFPGGC